jgi:hypothetical protein
VGESSGFTLLVLSNSNVINISATLEESSKRLFGGFKTQITDKESGGSSRRGTTSITTETTTITLASLVATSWGST